MMKLMLPTAKLISNILFTNVMRLMQLKDNLDIKETMLIQDKENRYHQSILTEDIRRIKNKYYLERRGFS